MLNFSSQGVSVTNIIHRMDKDNKIGLYYWLFTGVFEHAGYTWEIYGLYPQ